MSMIQMYVFEQCSGIVAIAAYLQPGFNPLLRWVWSLIVFRVLKIYNQITLDAQKQIM